MYGSRNTLAAETIDVSKIGLPAMRNGGRIAPPDQVRIYGEAYAHSEGGQERSCCCELICRQIMARIHAPRLFEPRSLSSATQS
jgi:hypothetical protein